MELINNMLAITTQACIAELGPMEDKHGDIVKEAFASTNTVMKLAMGCYLDDCLKEKSYDPLDRAIADLAKHKAKGSI